MSTAVVRSTTRQSHMPLFMATIKSTIAKLSIQHKPYSSEPLQDASHSYCFLVSEITRLILGAISAVHRLRLIVTGGEENAHEST